MTVRLTRRQQEILGMLYLGNAAGENAWLFQTQWRTRVALKNAGFVRINMEAGRAEITPEGIAYVEKYNLYV